MRRLSNVLMLAALGIVAAASWRQRPTPTTAWKHETYVYKTVGPTKIELDVYRLNGDTTRPAVVWIHGGALIMGNRHGVPRKIRRCAAEQTTCCSRSTIAWRPKCGCRRSSPT